MSHSLLELCVFHLSFLAFEIPLDNVLIVFLLVFFFVRSLVTKLLNLLNEWLYESFRFLDLFIWKFLDDDIAHSSSSRLTTTTHGTWFFNEFTFQGYHSVTDLAISNTCCKINSITYQGIFETKVEGILKLFICNIDKIIETLWAIRSLKRLLSSLSVWLCNFIETDKFSSTNLMVSEELNTFFTSDYIIYHNMIKYTAWSSDCAIKFLINSTEISKASKYTREDTIFLCLQ